MVKPQPGLKARALNYLSRREHSRAELEHKLARFAEDEAELVKVLDELQARGWLSEQRFVEQVMNVRRGKFGCRRLIHELREKGVSAAAIETAAAQYRDQDLAAARAVWQRKYGQVARDAQERARQMRFLQSRGFDMEVIRKVVQGSEE
jgi:regulatory protein